MISSQETNLTPEDINMSITDTFNLSDIEDNLTFSQLIEKYNDDSMFNTTLLDDSRIEPTRTSLCTNENGAIFTRQRTDYNTLSLKI